MGPEQEDYAREVRTGEDSIVGGKTQRARVMPWVQHGRPKLGLDRLGRVLEIHISLRNKPLLVEKCGN